jgi:shikimate kinase
MKIFLLGLPGSGKTTLGKELAGMFHSIFVDLDAEVVKSEGMTIPEIFSRKKEDHFRKAESKELKKWSGLTPGFVMATGGGTPCFFDNLAVMNQSGITIFLDVPPREIAKRIMSTNLADRPLFAKVHPENLKDQIEFMRSQRISYYRQARIMMSGVEISAEEIGTQIRKETQS